MNIKLPFLIFALFLLPKLVHCQNNEWAWRTFSSPEYHFSIQTPLPLVIKNAKDNPDALSLGSENGLKENFKIFIITGPFLNGLFGPDEKDALDLSNVSDQLTQKSFHKLLQGAVITSKSKSNSDGQITVLKGERSSKEGLLKFICLSETKGVYFWTVIVIYKKMDTEKEKIAEFVINSFKVIDYNPADFPIFTNEQFHFSIQVPYPIEPSGTTGNAERVWVVSKGVNGKRPPVRMAIWVKNFPSTSKLNIKDAGPALLKIVKNEKGITNPNTYYSWIKIKAKNCQAMITHGTCIDEDGVAKRLVIFNVLRGRHWWDVTLKYDADNRAQEEMAYQVIQSFQLLD